MLDSLGKQYPDWRRVNWKTEAAELGLSSVSQNAKPDATRKTGADQIIVAECYARIGELKAGHRRKLAMDALKLLGLRHALSRDQHIRSPLVVPEELTGRLKGGRWFPVAISLAAEVIPMGLLAREKTTLVEATALQTQGQARTARRRKDRV
jgi:hypothetical protein